jgi:hypothetical protein
MDFSFLINLLIFFPIPFQLIYGTAAVWKKTRISFNNVAFINLFLQLLFSIFIYKDSLRYLEKSKIKCFNPMLGVIGLITACFIVLTLIIIFQLILKYFLQKNINLKNDNTIKS